MKFKKPNKQARICYICQKILKINIWKIKNIIKLEIIVIAAHSICNLKYSVPEKVPITFHNGSNYDYHLIIKVLADEVKKQSTCLGENTEKHITFTLSIEEVTIKNDKNGEEITKSISYILQFIESERFMVRSLSTFVNNLSEDIHNIKCKYRRDNKKCETCETTCEVCHCFLKYKNFKDDLIEYKRLCCHKNNQQNFDVTLKEWFLITYKYSNPDKKFVLLLQKGVYPYEYIDDWEFNEISLTEKEGFYSRLDIEEIADADFAHAKRVCKDFEMKFMLVY